MPAHYHNLASKLDRAIVAYLIAEDVGDADTILPAKRSLDKPLPNITVAASALDVVDGDYFSGNRMATVNIAVRASHEAQQDNSTRLTSDALYGAVVDAMMKHGQSTDLLCDAINAAAAAAATGDDADLADFSCFGLLVLGERHGYDEDHVWNDFLRLQIHCCPSNVA